MDRRTHNLLLPILVALPCGGCFFGPPKTEVDRSREDVTREVVFARGELAALEVHAPRGLVVIRGGDTTYCSVDAEVVAGNRSDAERLAAGVGLSVQRPTTDLAVVGLVPAAGLRLDDVAGRWEIVVPPGVRVRVVSIAADVTIRGAMDDVDVQTVSGRVRARMAGGGLTCTTIDGAIELAGDYRVARLSSDRGELTVDLPPDLALTLDLELSSDRGEVRVRAPRADRFRIDFATESGVVRSELPVHWDSSTLPAANGTAHYLGTVGDGDSPAIARVRVASQTADLRLQELEPRTAATPAR